MCQVCVERGVRRPGRGSDFTDLVTEDESVGKAVPVGTERRVCM